MAQILCSFPGPRSKAVRPIRGVVEVVFRLIFDCHIPEMVQRAPGSPVCCYFRSPPIEQLARLRSMGTSLGLLLVICALFGASAGGADVASFCTRLVRFGRRLPNPYRIRPTKVQYDLPRFNIMVKFRVGCDVAFHMMGNSGRPDPASRELKQPVLLRASLVAANPCLDPTDADYRCEVDEEGYL